MRDARVLGPRDNSEQGSQQGGRLVGLWYLNLRNADGVKHYKYEYN